MTFGTKWLREDSMLQKTLSNYRERTPSERRAILLKNLAVTTKYLTLASVLAWAFSRLNHDSASVAIIYVLFTMLIARKTDGYIPGFLAAIVSVVFVNLVFTYPYMELDFTRPGYPVTFIGMTIISTVTSTLTAHLKEQTLLANEQEHQLMTAEKEKMRANLLRAISHDIRTPLTSMIGISSHCLEQADSMAEEEKRRSMELIHEDANWLLHMVENLLSITRINDQNAVITTTLEPVEEVVAAAVSQFYKRFPRASIRVQIPEELIMVPMDATLIRQVLINLLENAMYHSGSKMPPELIVTAGSSQVSFTVRDFGNGICPDILDTLFDGYTSDKNQSSDSHRGMGIGLSICKTIITAHGGSIAARNHDAGAEFTFTLPLS